MLKRYFVLVRFGAAFGLEPAVTRYWNSAKSCYKSGGQLI